MSGGSALRVPPKPSVTVVDVAGEPTEVIETFEGEDGGLGGSETSSAAPDLDVVIFPGNPGSALFYIPYMQSLHATLKKDFGRVRCRAVSHLGHSRDIYKAAFYTLEDQVVHKQRFLEKVYSGEKGDKAGSSLLVVGHSIGGFMALEAVKRWQASEKQKRRASRHSRHVSDTCRIFAQMPYMQFDEGSPKQLRLEKVAQRPYIPAAFAQCLGLVPHFLTVRLIRLFDKNVEAESARHVAGQLLSYTVGHNAFSLARDEFKSLRRKEIDWQWLKGEAARLGFVFCPGDHWSPRHLHRATEENLAPKSWVRFEPRQFHGFVTRHDSSHHMAELTRDFLGASSSSTS